MIALRMELIAERSDEIDSSYVRLQAEKAQRLAQEYMN